MSSSFRTRSRSKSPPKRATEYSKAEKFAQALDRDIRDFVEDYIITDRKLYTPLAIDSMVIGIDNDLRLKVNPKKIIIKYSLFPKWVDRSSINSSPSPRMIEELELILKKYQKHLFSSDFQKPQVSSDESSDESSSSDNEDEVVSSEESD